MTENPEKACIIGHCEQPPAWTLHLVANDGSLRSYRRKEVTYSEVSVARKGGASPLMLVRHKPLHVNHGNGSSSLSLPFSVKGFLSSRNLCHVRLYGPNHGQAASCHHHVRDKNTSLW